MVDRSLETAAQMSRFAIASAAFRIRHAMRFGDEKQTGVVDSIGSCSRAEVTSPSSATRRQNACNVLICGSRKPKVGTTRHRAGERGRGAQTQIRGGGWAGKFSLSC